MGLQQIGQGPVFGAGGLFGVIDLLVQVDFLVGGQAADKAQQPGKPLVIGLAPHQLAHEDGPGVDHGVQVLGQQGVVRHVDGVKGLAGGLHPHMGPDGLPAVVLQGQQKQKGLHHALDGEAAAAVAGLHHVAVLVEHGDTQAVRVLPGQLRDIGGQGALAGVRAALL